MDDGLGRGEESEDEVEEEMASPRADDSSSSVDRLFETDGEDQEEFQGFRDGGGESEGKYEAASGECEDATNGISSREGSMGPASGSDGYGESPRSASEDKDSWRDPGALRASASPFGDRPAIREGSRSLLDDYDPGMEPLLVDISAKNASPASTRLCRKFESLGTGLDGGGNVGQICREAPDNNQDAGLLAALSETRIDTGGGAALEASEADMQGFGRRESGGEGEGAGDEPATHNPSEGAVVMDGVLPAAGAEAGRAKSRKGSRVARRQAEAFEAAIKACSDAYGVSLATFQGFDIGDVVGPERLTRSRATGRHVPVKNANGESVVVLSNGSRKLDGATAASSGSKQVSGKRTGKRSGGRGGKLGWGNVLDSSGHMNMEDDKNCKGAEHDSDEQYAGKAAADGFPGVGVKSHDKTARSKKHTGSKHAGKTSSRKPGGKKNLKLRMLLAGSENDGCTQANSNTSLNHQVPRQTGNQFTLKSDCKVEAEEQDQFQKPSAAGNTVGSATTVGPSRSLHGRQRGTLKKSDARRQKQKGTIAGNGRGNVGTSDGLNNRNKLRECSSSKGIGKHDVQENGYASENVCLERGDVIPSDVFNAESQSEDNVKREGAGRKSHFFPSTDTAETSAIGGHEAGQLDIYDNVRSAYKRGLSSNGGHCKELAENAVGWDSLSQENGHTPSRGDLKIESRQEEVRFQGEAEECPATSMEWTRTVETEVGMHDRALDFSDEGHVAKRNNFGRHSRRHGDDVTNGSDVVCTVGEDLSSGVTEGESNSKNSPTSLNGEDAIEVDDVRAGWVLCDACQKWRCIPAELADQIEATNATWTCKDNPNKEFGDCKIPQEKSNAEINAELKITDESDAEEDKDKEGDIDSDLPQEIRPAVWTLIPHNIYRHRPRKILKTADEMMICNCKPPTDGRPGCGEDCLNRLLAVECVPETCPCGEACSNRQFQKRLYAKVGFFRCGKKGFGLRALENIPCGTFITEYVGEVLDIRAFEVRQKDYARNGQKHFYFMTLNSNEVIDACAKGNLGRFINHSCEPNCETEKWMVNGEVCIGLFSIKNLLEGEEITFDYNYVRVGGAAAKKCECGTPGCRGFIGGDPPTPRAVIESDSDEGEDPEPIMLEENMEAEARLSALGTVADLTKIRSAKRAKMSSEPKVKQTVINKAGSVKRKSPPPIVDDKDEAKPKALSAVKRVKTSSSAHVKKGSSLNLKGLTIDAGNRQLRSDVEEKLNEMLDENGGLRKKKDCAKHFLRLLVLVPVADDVESRLFAHRGLRDLSLLLDALLKTRSLVVLRDIMGKNGLMIFHNLVKHFRKSYNKVPILRKLLKVLELLASQGLLVAEQMRASPAGNGRESLSESLFELTRHNDKEIQMMARVFRRNYIPPGPKPSDMCVKENGWPSPPQHVQQPDQLIKRGTVLFQQSSQMQDLHFLPLASEQVLKALPTSIQKVTAQACYLSGIRCDASSDKTYIDKPADTGNPFNTVDLVLKEQDNADAGEGVPQKRKRKSRWDEEVPPACSTFAGISRAGVQGSHGQLSPSRIPEASSQFQSDWSRQPSQGYKRYWQQQPPPKYPYFRDQSPHHGCQDSLGMGPHRKQQQLHQEGKQNLSSGPQDVEFPSHAMSSGQQTSSLPGPSPLPPGFSPSAMAATLPGQVGPPGPHAGSLPGPPLPPGFSPSTISAKLGPSGMPPANVLCGPTAGGGIHGLSPGQMMPQGPPVQVLPMGSFPPGSLGPHHMQGMPGGQTGQWQLPEGASTFVGPPGFQVDATEREHISPPWAKRSSGADHQVVKKEDEGDMEPEPPVPGLSPRDQHLNESKGTPKVLSRDKSHETSHSGRQESSHLGPVAKELLGPDPGKDRVRKELWGCASDKSARSEYDRNKAGVSGESDWFRYRSGRYHGEGHIPKNHAQNSARWEHSASAYQELAQGRGGRTPDWHRSEVGGSTRDDLSLPALQGRGGTQYEALKGRQNSFDRDERSHIQGNDITLPHRVREGWPSERNAGGQKLDFEARGSRDVSEKRELQITRALQNQQPSFNRIGEFELRRDPMKLQASAESGKVHIRSEILLEKRSSDGPVALDGRSKGTVSGSLGGSELQCGEEQKSLEGVVWGYKKNILMPSTANSTERMCGKGEGALESLKVPKEGFPSGTGVENGVLKLTSEDFVLRDKGKQPGIGVKQEEASVVGSGPRNTGRLQKEWTRSGHECLEGSLPPRGAEGDNNSSLIKEVQDKHGGDSKERIRGPHDFAVQNSNEDIKSVGKPRVSWGIGSMIDHPVHASGNVNVPSAPQHDPQGSISGKQKKTRDPRCIGSKNQEEMPRGARWSEDVRDLQGKSKHFEHSEANSGKFLQQSVDSERPDPTEGKRMGPSHEGSHLKGLQQTVVDNCDGAVLPDGRADQMHFLPLEDLRHHSRSHGPHQGQSSEEANEKTNPNSRQISRGHVNSAHDKWESPDASGFQEHVEALVRKYLGGHKQLGPRDADKLHARLGSQIIRKERDKYRTSKQHGMVKPILKRRLAEKVKSFVDSQVGSYLAMKEKARKG